VLGTVELDLAMLVDEKQSDDNILRRRRDELQADKPGMKHAGILHWSVRFCPLWQMSEKEMNERIIRLKGAQGARPGPADSVGQLWWIDWLSSWVEDKPEWEELRARKRKESLAWFTSELERDEMEASIGANEDLRSGVLQASSSDTRNIYR
jgi:hypothetical protein